MDWEKFKPKRILELEKENAALYDKIFKLEKEIEDLKFQLSSSDLIIAEYEGRVLALKAEVKELMLKVSNNAVQNSTEINNCSNIVHNERGAGRKSRVNEKTLELIKSLQNKGLSYSQIAEKLTEVTKKPWSKSTISYILGKNNTAF
jgi:hypothetical protein